MPLPRFESSARRTSPLPRESSARRSFESSVRRRSPGLYGIGACPVVKMTLPDRRASALSYPTDSLTLSLFPPPPPPRNERSTSHPPVPLLYPCAHVPMQISTIFRCHTVHRLQVRANRKRRQFTWPHTQEAAYGADKQTRLLMCEVPACLVASMHALVMLCPKHLHKHTYTRWQISQCLRRSYSC